MRFLRQRIHLGNGQERAEQRKEKHRVGWLLAGTQKNIPVASPLLMKRLLANYSMKLPFLGLKSHIL
jgi:hypothetical protein